MEFFEQNGNALLFRENGEVVQIEAWGNDSLRIRSRFMGDIEEGSIALLPPSSSHAQITIHEWEAQIQNGKIRAVIEVQPWGKDGRITFYNQKGEILLREIANGGALMLKARSYHVKPGGNFSLKVSFDSNPEEKLYGMGQYQQETLNLKGCNLELAHRNSQASIPFMFPASGTDFYGIMLPLGKFILEQIPPSGVPNPLPKWIIGLLPEIPPLK